MSELETNELIQVRINKMNELKKRESILLASVLTAAILLVKSLTILKNWKEAPLRSPGELWLSAVMAKPVLW